MIERVCAAGYKATGPRKRILAALSTAREPLTAAQIAECAGTSVASTYRALSLLSELGVVSETAEANNGGAADPRSRRYLLCTAKGHHHHFVCRSCHATIEVASEALERAVAGMERDLGLRVERHEVTLSGTCARCREEARS